nr:MAG TPA: Putative metallopeptidase [Caudoviricetes sp.]
MKIPSKVRVGSVDYAINSKDERQILNSKQCYGIIDYDYHTIELDNGIIDYDYHTIELDNGIRDIQGLELTFLHELVHAIVRENKIDLDGDFEEVTDKLAYGLHQVIRDNPSIFCSCDCDKVDLTLDGKIIAKNLVNKVGD